MAQGIKQSEKIKLIEKEVKTKEHGISELIKNKEELEYNLTEASRRMEEQDVKIRELEGEMEERQRDFIRIQER